MHDHGWPCCPHRGAAAQIFSDFCWIFSLIFSFALPVDNRFSGDFSAQHTITPTIEPLRTLGVSTAFRGGGCNSCDLCYWIFLFDISFLFLSSFSSFLSFPKRLSLHAHETALFRFPFRFPLLLFPYLHRESDLLSLLSFEGTILLPLHPRSHAVLVLYSHRLALAALV